ncbi:hypothetical protein GCM10009836_43690 [Pseudonocardia ailaonensis]|uniref:4Fe-4S Wbl-type domain-containing protein n=1 Tax=Pseudonocardia ailaonensis TaxID=367279 RepID=A0ABN2N9B4_9PSEU
MSDQEWRSSAACLAEDPELFFPVVEEGPLCAEQVAAAKAVCHRCPVREICLADSMERLSYGIAGGLTSEERRELRAPGRQGPSKVPSPRRIVRSVGLQLIEAGATTRAVAKRCGVADRTVERWKAARSA